MIIVDRNLDMVCRVRESFVSPGQVLLSVATGGPGGPDSLGNAICLTRDQARSLGDELIRFSDVLFFEEQRKKAARNEQE